VPAPSEQDWSVKCSAPITPQLMTPGPAAFFQLQARLRVRYTSKAEACYG